MKQYFTVLALVVLSGQVNAATCGELSYSELIAAAKRGSVATPVECPQKAEASPQELSAADCREALLSILTNLNNKQNVQQSKQDLWRLANTLSCPADVLETAGQGLEIFYRENLRALGRSR